MGELECAGRRYVVRPGAARLRAERPPGVTRLWSGSVVAGISRLFTYSKVIGDSAGREPASLNAFEMDGVLARRKRGEHHPVSIGHGRGIDAGRLRTTKTERRQKEGNC